MAPFVKSIFALSLCFEGWWVMGRIIFSCFWISFCKIAQNSPQVRNQEKKKNIYIYIYKYPLPTCYLLSPSLSSRWPIKQHHSSALRHQIQFGNPWGKLESWMKDASWKAGISEEGFESRAKITRSFEVRQTRVNQKSDICYFRQVIVLSEILFSHR